MVMPWLTKKVGIQPVTLYEPNMHVIARIIASRVRGITGRVNSTVIGTHFGGAP
ncbi:hypothetical protein D3C80_2136730 [compost metagenome]